MVKLIFDTELTGHHPEYINHLYTAAVKDTQNIYFFSIPKDGFDRMNNIFEWKNRNNIRFRLLTKDELLKIHGGLISKCITTSKLIKNISQEVKATKIILINLATVVPVLPLILSNSTKVSGIIYQIYLHNPKKGIRGFVDRLRYFVLSKSKSIDKVFILNDPCSADKLNKIYLTSVYKPLPDPLPYIERSKLENLRSKLPAEEKQNIFLHIGAMSERKGTIELLKAILLLPLDYNATFIFAGAVNKDIKDQFNHLTKKILDLGYNLLVYNQFITYDFFNNLCYTSDCILIPYKVTSQSSGIIGYASYFQKPVIGPNSGIIGDLVNKYHLGYLINEITPEAIADSILKFDHMYISEDYALSSSIENFSKTMLD
jgi:glycosyltransferase involved in cell wall biosynthesis